MRLVWVRLDQGDKLAGHSDAIVFWWNARVSSRHSDNDINVNIALKLVYESAHVSFKIHKPIFTNLLCYTWNSKVSTPALDIDGPLIDNGGY